jgi:2-hydroxy-3-keto-5-methylthiopentenyl-1-phosphate phosphatase
MQLLYANKKKLIQLCKEKERSMKEWEGHSTISYNVSNKITYVVNKGA